MTRRAGLTGISTNAPGLIGVRNTRRSIPLPSGSLPRPEPLLERGYLSQALLDIGAMFFLFLFIISAALSVPLAMFLLLFARF